MISRRAFLAGLTTLTADALVRSAGAQAPVSGDRIDVHHHFASSTFIAIISTPSTGVPAGSARCVPNTCQPRFAM